MPEREIFHASAVAIDGQGCLLLGPSGSGKSALALMLIALGADLIGDDAIEVERAGSEVWLQAPPSLPAAIEARHVGLLAAPLAGKTRLSLVVKMDETESERLPPRRTTPILGCDITCLHNVPQMHFPYAICHYLRRGPAQL